MTAAELRDIAERRQQHATALREALRHAAELNLSIERAAMLGSPTDTMAELLDLAYGAPDALREAIEHDETLSRLARERIAELEHGAGEES
jgi:hypothetical protein